MEEEKWIRLCKALKNMAEEVGFEPTDLSVYGFQDRRLRPLGHSSKKLNAGAIHELPLLDYLINFHIID